MTLQVDERVGGESLKGSGSEMQQQLLADILAKRRDRAIAIILGVKERECDRNLSPQASAKLRKVVLDQVNDLVDLSLDLMQSLDSESAVTLNELYWDKLESMLEAVKSQ